MLLDRDRRAGKYLEWKVRLFATAAVVGLAGIYLESRLVTGMAILILIGAVLLRWLPTDSEETGED